MRSGDCVPCGKFRHGLGSPRLENAQYAAAAMYEQLSALSDAELSLSIETGKDTDFVIVMSGEPQGALKVRQREPRPADPWSSPYGGKGKSSPFGGGFLWKF